MTEKQKTHFKMEEGKALQRFYADFTYAPKDATAFPRALHIGHAKTEEAARQLVADFRDDVIRAAAAFGVPLAAGEVDTEALRQAAELLTRKAESPLPYDQALHAFGLEIIAAANELDQTRAILKDTYPLPLLKKLYSLRCPACNHRLGETFVEGEQTLYCSEDCCQEQEGDE